MATTAACDSTRFCDMSADRVWCGMDTIAKVVAWRGLAWPDALAPRGAWRWWMGILG